MCKGNKRKLKKCTFYQKMCKKKQNTGFYAKLSAKISTLQAYLIAVSSLVDRDK
jgi:hypothetical protein